MGVDGNTQWILFAVFCIGSIPIVVHDLRNQEVPAVWLAVLLAGLAAAVAVFEGESGAGRYLGASAALAAGGLVLAALPGRLGEADVLYAAAFPFVLDFFPLLFALGLACAGGMALFAYRAAARQSWTDVPVPFTPLLFWGVAAQFLIGGLSH